MIRVSLVSSVLVLLASLALAAQPSATTAADVAEVKSYRLTETNLKQFIAATRNILAASQNDPRYQKLAALQTERKALEAKDDPSDAEIERMETLDAEIEQAEEALPSMEGHDESLSEMEAAMRKEPALMKALTQAGMTPREYATFSVAFAQASLVYGMQKAGMIKQLSKELEAMVNMDNVKFIEQHEDQIKALTAEFEKLQRGQG